MIQYPDPEFIRLARERLRAPVESWVAPVHNWDANGEFVFTFDPPLDPTEQAQYDAIRKAVKVAMTPEVYALVRSQMQSLRDLRQMGRAGFMALTAAERDRLTYDALTDVTRVLVALLRDAE